MLESLCAPAILYIAFSITQTIIDIFKNMYNTAFLKFIVMIIFTTILNILCQRGLGIISWLIVFIPFITMTIITSLLLFVFGLSPSTGNLNYNVVENPSQQLTQDKLHQQPLPEQSIVQSYPLSRSYIKKEPYSPELVGTFPTMTLSSTSST